MSFDNPYASPSLSTESPFYPLQDGRREIKNVKPEIGEIVDYALQIWKANLGLLIGATVIVFAIIIGFAFFQGIVDTILRGGDPRPTAASTTVSLLLTIASNVLQTFIGIGNLQLMLALLRGQPASIGMLFGGGERLLSTIGVAIVLGLAITVGFLLLIIPGIIVILFYWPAYYLVIDQRTPVMQSFTVARTITKGNELTFFVLVLLSFAIAMIGLLALCVGFLAAQPLALLLFACAYLMMSGQIPTKAPQPA
jgi:hypothetical protein